MRRKQEVASENNYYKCDVMIANSIMHWTRQIIL